jgi:NAD(P)-dependent dehydrogenase (short-subunit alcohol dehydrogenase family)
VLISAAAGNFPAPALGISPNDFQPMIDIDLGGNFHPLRAAYPMLHKPGCSVINISAPQAFLPMELQTHACAATAGVDMLALEWGGARLRVNSICSGPIEGTEKTYAALPLRLRSMAVLPIACLWVVSGRCRILPMPRCFCHRRWRVK